MVVTFGDLMLNYFTENSLSERRGATKTKTTTRKCQEGEGGGGEGDDRIREAILRRLEVRSMIETPI